MNAPSRILRGLCLSLLVGALTAPALADDDEFTSDFAIERCGFVNSGAQPLLQPSARAAAGAGRRRRRRGSAAGDHRPRRHQGHRLRGAERQGDARRRARGRGTRVEGRRARRGVAQLLRPLQADQRRVLLRRRGRLLRERPDRRPPRRLAGGRERRAAGHPGTGAVPARRPLLPGTGAGRGARPRRERGDGDYPPPRWAELRGCVAVAETSAIESGESAKVYCPGVGLVLDDDIALTSFGG